MVKTKIFMMLVLLLATSAEAGPKKDPLSQNDPKTTQEQQEQAQDAAPNGRDLQEPVQVQQEQVAIQPAAPYFSEGRLDRILTANLAGHILGWLLPKDCTSLACSGRPVHKKIQGAVPNIFRTSEVSAMLLNAKPGMFREIYADALYEVPNIQALSKNTPHLHFRRLTATVLDLKKLMNGGQALTPEVIERLKELELPLAGPIELLRHKELWPQVCILSLDVNRPDYPVDLLRPFAEQENRQLTFMIKCNVSETREDALIKNYHSNTVREERSEKRRASVRGTYGVFFRLMDEIEKLNVGLVRDLDCVLSDEYESAFWSEQFSHLLEKKCFQDLRGYHFCFLQSIGIFFAPLEMLNHLPSSIESLSMPAHFLLHRIVPRSYDREGAPLINLDLPPTNRTGRNIINRLKQMQSLKEFNLFDFSSIRYSPSAFYALCYFPKDIMVRGKLGAHQRDATIAVLNHFSRLDSGFEVSFSSSDPFAPNDLIAQALKRHPLIKKDWCFRGVFDSKDIFLEEVTHLALCTLEDTQIDFSCLKNLKKLELGFAAGTDSKMVEQFFQSCRQSFPKNIIFTQESGNGSGLVDAVKALPVHIEALHLNLSEEGWKKAGLFADHISHLQNLKEFSFQCTRLDPEAKKGVQKLFNALSRFPSLRTLSCLIKPRSWEVLKLMPPHIEKLQISVSKWTTLKLFPEELFALNNLKELYLRAEIYDSSAKRDILLDPFVASLSNMKSLKKVTIVHPEPYAPVPFLSEKALVGIEKVFIYDF